MNTNQFENIAYKDISYNCRKNIPQNEKEQINPNIYYNQGKKSPKIIYSKKKNNLKINSFNSTSSSYAPTFYNRTQNSFYSPSQPYFEEIARIKNASFLQNQLKKLKMNYISLSNDNIILKEDINKLVDMNEKLEHELSNQRENNYELAKENDILNNENHNLINKLEEVGQKIMNIKDNYHKENELMNKQKYFEEKINEKDLGCKEIIEENNKFNYEYELLNNKFKELKEKNDKDEKELNNLKEIQDQSITNIENKISNLLGEMERLKYENSQLKKENETFNINIINNEQEKNEYYNEYQEQKMKNEMLTKEVDEIKSKYQECQLQFENRITKENNKKKIQKNKSDNKINVIKDLHKKILQYKTERVKRRCNLKEDEDSKKNDVYF